MQVQRRVQVGTKGTVGTKGAIFTEGTEGTKSAVGHVSFEISFGLDMKVFPGQIFGPLVKLLWLALDNNDLKDIEETDLYR